MDSNTPATASSVNTEVEPLTYSTYLRVGELISLQRPLSNPPAHEEMLFIVTHQTYELWFKQIIHELDAFVAHVDGDRLGPSLRVLERVREIFRVLIQQVDVLETMTPAEFNRFRAAIGTASGFQSVQFRELELLAGIDPGDIPKFPLEPEWKARLASRISKPTMRSALFGLLRRRGLLSGEDEAAIRSALLRMLQDQEELAMLARLCEDLVRFDEQLLLWRFRHVQMAERMIGKKMGTGGSAGVSYLQSTLQKRCFPELWDVRTALREGKQYH
jgi:tryptophan 2,3-dioxygenase